MPFKAILCRFTAIQRHTVALLIHSVPSLSSPLLSSVSVLACLSDAPPKHINASPMPAWSAHSYANSSRTFSSPFRRVSPLFFALPSLSRAYPVLLCSRRLFSGPLRSALVGAVAQPAAPHFGSLVRCHASLCHSRDLLLSPVPCQIASVLFCSAATLCVSTQCPRITEICNSQS